VTAAFDIDLALAIGARRVRVQIASEARAIAVVGPSGIGKSTLLRAIAGLVPSAGRISIAGRSLERVPTSARALGWVPQEALLFPHLTVAENVAFARRGRAAIPELTSALGISALLDRAPATLSGGERQRVAIARALAASPIALLLDEPLAALDRAARAEVAGAIAGYCERNDVARILVAHDEADVAALATERFALGEGGVRRDGT
jgi:ABC-type sulfate/molybdate transport systems ATPase subunit